MNNRNAIIIGLISGLALILIVNVLKEHGERLGRLEKQLPTINAYTGAVLFNFRPHLTNSTTDAILFTP